jgi:DtxR family Mn-dependent transcriptional regulator
MSDLITDSIQDYLKSIYVLTAEGGSASTTALAARLGIAPASVTGMLQRLAGSEPPLVSYRKHQGATLTPDGRRAALEVIRHHRLLEAWLVNDLGYSWDQVRVAAALGNPARDPHGDPIPSADLTMPPDESRPLSSLRPTEKATILRVQAGDAALLRHLEDLGLVPGVQIEVAGYSPYDGNLSVKIAGRPAEVLGPVITDEIFVESKL